MSDKFTYGKEQGAPLFTTAGAALVIAIAAFALILHHIFTS